MVRHCVLTAVQARRAHANDIASLEFASNQLQAKYRTSLSTAAVTDSAESSLESASLEASSQRSAAR